MGLSTRKQKQLFFLLIGICTLILYVIMQVSHSSHSSNTVSSGWLSLQLEILDISGIAAVGERDALARSLGRSPDGCKLKDLGNRESSTCDLRVIVMTYARPKSLLRLIKSLNQANYGDDKVILEIWIDRSKSQQVHQETLHLLSNATFSKGKCNTIIHPYHVGIRGQWLATWRPNPDSSEIVVLLEDDLTVSPHFYSYLKLVHKKYEHRQDLYGFTLQGYSVRHSDGACCLKVPLENKVFLYPTLGTSGFSPKREHWLKFQEWLQYVLIGNVDVPLIKNHVASDWYKTLSKNGKADSMWEMEYLFYTSNQNQHVLYPNFEGQRGFTFNWYEGGLHSTGEDVKHLEDERKKLVLSWNWTINDLPDSPVHVDIKGEIVHDFRDMN